MVSSVLLIFVKAPRPGLVKTRLASAIGPEAACEIYRRLLHRLFEQLREIDRVQVHFDPADARVDIESLIEKRWDVEPQSGGDLGSRLKAAFASAFSRNIERVVVIGSDCPDIHPEDIHAAWERLGSHDLVIGPALDGGYWLIGLNQPRPTLFEEIQWSGPRVREQTLEKARSLGLSIHLLRELADIDTHEDWLASEASSRQFGAPKGKAL